MKNLSVKSTIVAGVLGLTIFTGNANAYCSNLKFYVGASADYNAYKVSRELKDHVDTIANSKIRVDGLGMTVPMLGVRFHHHLGAEAGYTFNKKLKISSNTPDSVVRVRNMYMDLVGFMPVAKHIELVGGLGVGKLLTVKSENLAYIDDIRNKFSFRAKAGVNYHCHQNMGIRGIVTYQNVGNVSKSLTNPRLNDSKFIKNMMSLSVGLTYTF